MPRCSANAGAASFPPQTRVPFGVDHTRHQKALLAHSEQQSGMTFHLPSSNPPLLQRRRPRLGLCTHCCISGCHGKTSSIPASSLRRHRNKHSHRFPLEAVERWRALKTLKPRTAFHSCVMHGAEIFLRDHAEFSFPFFPFAGGVLLLSDSNLHSNDGCRHRL